MRRKGIISQEGRECSKCGKYKLWSSYNVAKTGTRGRNSNCKECCSQYFKSNRDMHNKRAREYRNKNKDSCYSNIKKYIGKMDGGVYMVTCEEGRYVGSSKHMIARMRNHRDWNEMSPVNSKVLKEEVIEVVEDPKLRLDREDYYIRKLKPELNDKFPIFKR